MRVVNLIIQPPQASPHTHYWPRLLDTRSLLPQSPIVYPAPLINTTMSRAITLLSFVTLTVFGTLPVFAQGGQTWYEAAPPFRANLYIQNPLFDAFSFG